MAYGTDVTLAELEALSGVWLNPTETANLPHPVPKTSYRDAAAVSAFSKALISMHRAKDVPHPSSCKGPQDKTGVGSG